MPTLSVVKTDFLKIVKWLLIILGILIGIFLFIKGFLALKEKIRPTPPPPPTVAFCKIPFPYFPQGIKKEFTYSIDTISGKLPVLPDRANVYKLGQSEPDILAVQKMSERAESLDFNPDPEQLSENVYRWRGKDIDSRILVVDVLLGVFNLSSDYLSNDGILNQGGSLSEDNAIITAKTFLDSLGLYPQDLDETKTKTKLLKVENGVLYDVDKPNETKIVSVNFFQKDLDELPFVYPVGGDSNMQITVAGGSSSREVIDGRYFYQNIIDESATYPIISADKAYEQLKKGEAFIASFDNSSTNIIIKKVYLAFYAPRKTQEYLTPVIVFEGKNNFSAYVPAISSEWMKK